MSVKDFTEKNYVKRRNTSSAKWDIPSAEGKLPMWVADMDFKTEERITENLKKRIESGVYGYAIDPEDYAEAMIGWNQRRHGVTYEKDWIRYSAGAIDGIIQCLSAFTKKDDPVLICTPVYPPFYSSVKRTGRKLIESKLSKDGDYFTMDYKDIEKRFKKYGVKAMILCSPHNPLGRVWKKGELEELFDLCERYNVLVISDEVHSDLIMPDQEFVPSLSFKKHQKHIVTISAVSKTFNLAMFHHCHVLIADKKLRKIFDQYQYETHREDPNAFSLLPSYYGYKYGDEWLDGLIEVVFDNFKYLKKRLDKYCEILPLEGTYLAFLDLGKYTENGKQFLLDCGILANAGETFGKDYASWVRLNLATSHANVKKACDAIEKAIKAL